MLLTKYDKICDKITASAGVAWLFK